MIEAPASFALSRLEARLSRQRKDGSSEKPTGIRGSLIAAAGAIAASRSRQPRMRRARVIGRRLEGRAGRPYRDCLEAGPVLTDPLRSSTPVSPLLGGPAQALDLAPVPLRRQPLLDRLARRAGRSARPPDLERLPERGDE